jgi:16S rRNA (uracil1498-N3)-methyltransferase
MARRLFFVPEVRNGAAELSGDDAKHLTRVLRVERGQVYQISDNENLYLAEVKAAHKEAVEFTVIEKMRTPAPLPELRLFAALIKFDHFEWMIEKAAELGVTSVIPIQTARAEAGLEKAAAKRLDRWRKIALESSQQCRRVTVPAIAEVIPFSEAVAATASTRLFADEEDSGLPLLEAAVTAPAAVLIGPEGGWTEREREQASGWTRVSLSRQILRAETAAIAAAVILSLRLSANLK